MHPRREPGKQTPITWQQMRQQLGQLEQKRQQLVLQQEPQQLVQEQQEQQLLLFCRKRTEQQRR
jgi:hypothetical protein